MPSFKTRIVFLLLTSCLLMTTTLLYFMVTFEDNKIYTNIAKNRSKPPVIVGFAEVKKKNETLQETFAKLIEAKLVALNESILFGGGEHQFEQINQQLAALREDLTIHNGNGVLDLKQLWTIPRRWIRARQIVPSKAPELGDILWALQRAKIVKSDVARKGTQLKLMLTLDGGQMALFKPRKYSRDYITDGIYAGADRHNGEIIAFHLARILQLPYVPIAASRIIDVATEAKAVATPALLKTFVTNPVDDNQTVDCFYGECYYCNEYNQMCPEADGKLEGAIILMLPLHYQLQKLRHPWQRTYKKNLKAQWESDANYCLSLTKLKSDQQRLLDLIDTSVFDYLIGNADRHHYEVFKDVPNSALLLIDNGKSFGDPSHDELTILFPLLQCCLIRNSTYHQLRLLSLASVSPEHRLSSMLTTLLSNDQLWPLLTNAHLAALDRRLLSILAAIETCFDKNNKQHVLF